MPREALLEVALAFLIDSLSLSLEIEQNERFQKYTDTLELEKENEKYRPSDHAFYWFDSTTNGDHYHDTEQKSRDSHPH